MIFSAKNVKLRLNTVDILANQCTLSIQAGLDPRYDAGSRHSRDYYAQNGIGSRLNFSHYLTGSLDDIKKLVSTQGEMIGDDGMSNEGQIVSGSFGGMVFTSGYLSSYSIQFTPNSPVVANSEVVFFDDLTGRFVQTEEAAPKEEILNCKNITFANSSSSEMGEINDFITANYNYTSEINPVYLAGATVPERIYFGRKNVSMGIDVDNPTGYVPYDGITANFAFNMAKHNSSIPVERFSCYGRLQSRTVQASVGGRVTHQLGIVTHNPHLTHRVFGIRPVGRPVTSDVVGVPRNVY